VWLWRTLQRLWRKQFEQKCDLCTLKLFTISWEGGASSRTPRGATGCMALYLTSDIARHATKPWVLTELANRSTNPLRPSLRLARGRKSPRGVYSTFSPEGNKD
jgi:hypothetical protein